MQIPIYQVDAFAQHLFAGNPAAICVLEQWLPEEIMQKIALENNLSETAFIVQQAVNEYAIRWFAINKEIPLCGHGTLASAYVVFTYLQPQLSQIIFHSQSGPLIVTRQNAMFYLDFPAIKPEPLVPPTHLLATLPYQPQECYQAHNCLLVFADEQQIYDFKPMYEKWQPFPWHGLIVTAPSKDYDFVSRFFVPNRTAEDPVTGSAHCMLTPYWVKRIGKTRLYAKQLSARGGDLSCELQGDRVLLGGNVVPYLQGVIQL